MKHDERNKKHTYQKDRKFTSKKFSKPARIEKYDYEKEIKFDGFLSRMEDYGMDDGYEL